MKLNGQKSSDSCYYSSLMFIVSFETQLSILFSWSILNRIIYLPYWVVGILHTFWIQPWQIDTYSAIIFSHLLGCLHTSWWQCLLKYQKFLWLWEVQFMSVWCLFLSVACSFGVTSVVPPSIQGKRFTPLFSSSEFYMMSWKIYLFTGMVSISCGSCRTQAFSSSFHVIMSSSVAML